MTFIQKFNTFLKKKNFTLSNLEIKTLKIHNFRTLILVSFLIFFSALFFISSNLINKQDKENKNSFKEITKSEGFLNLSKLLIAKINSPYDEINYVIKNNDTIEKILKNLK